MPRFQINYQYREVEPTDQTGPIKGSVIYVASVIGKAIDAASAQLTQDEDVASFVITAAKEIS
jgi:hypothetical protein